MMKKIMLSAALLLSFWVQCIAQNASQPSKITIKFVNNSILPRKYSFIGYEPGVTGNWTNAYILGPGCSHKYELPEGTKIYLASQKQVGIVMSGKSLLNDMPFWIVKASDEGKRIRLR